MLGYDIVSGGIGINITQNEETALPSPYPRLIVGNKALAVSSLVIPAQPELIW